MQEEQGGAADANTGASADIGEGLRPANRADMRDFLALSGFLVDFLPLPGPAPFRGCACPVEWLLSSYGWSHRAWSWRLARSGAPCSWAEL